MKRLRGIVSAFIMMVCLVAGLLPSYKVLAADTLTEQEKNSSYGFFVWLSENAETADERSDAEAAAQLLKNKVGDAYGSKVFNNGTIISGTSVAYADLVAATDLGAENDATSLECLKESVNFVTLGNTYRAKENLHALKISSALMAMSELNANYQDNESLVHSSAFLALENLAFRQLEGTWKYGTFNGVSDDPYEGWYTEEKSNYEKGSGVTGHYKTMTDRQGTMYLTGFGVRHRYVEDSVVASDNNSYDVTFHDKYYSQHFSDASNMYDIGSGVTPEKYMEYLNKYKCELGNHELVETAAVAKTCTKDGNTAYYTCSVCNKVFSDKEGKNEINIEDTVIPAGHEWNEEYTVDKEATCKEEGSKSIHCSVCDATDESTVTVIPKTDHTYGEWKTTKKANCTEDGSRKKTCDICGDKVTEVIPAKGHTWNEEYTVDKEATCKEEGSKSIHCSVCDATDESTVTVIPKTDHTYGEWKTTKEASCTEDGSREKICDVCGDKVTEVIPAKGHTWNEEYTVDKKATCSEEGSKSIHCSVCDAIDESTVTVIPKADHTYGEWETTKEATCTEDGSKEKVCKTCGDKVTQAIPATGHSYGDWTYVDETIHRRTCQHDESHTEEGSHRWDEGKVTKEPSRGVFGEITYTCSVCKGERTEEVKATVDSVTKQIEDLPNPAGVDDEEEVKDAETALGYLSEEDQKKIPADTLEKLENAKAQVNLAKELAPAKEIAKEELRTYKKAEDYRQAQQTELEEALENAIEAIDQADSLDKINEIVTNTKKAVDEIKTDAELTAIENQEAADKVTEMINDLPTDLQASDEQKVEDARAAFKALNDDQKALVSKDALEALDQAEVDIVTKKIEAVANTDELSLDDKDAVAEAKKAYDSLLDEQKKKVSKDLLDALTSAENKISALEEDAKSKNAESVKVSSIRISGISNKIAIKKKIRLTATLYPNNATNKKVKWTSSNPKLVTVDQNGVVKVGKKAARKTVVITATATDGSGKKASWKIKGMKGAVKKIALKGKKKVKAGKAIKIKAKVKAGKGANKKLKWISSDPKIATVSSSGKVKTSKAGKGKTVKITAMATDGTGEKKAIQIKIK